ncbi:MAG: hypothetical protein ACRERV_15580, partial [Methylococcales bacterium]
MAYPSAIASSFQADPPATVNEAGHRIAELTEPDRSPTAIRTFLKRCGLKRLKTGVLPAKAQPPQSRRNLKKTPGAPRLNEAKAGQRAVFFVDAACLSFMAHSSGLRGVWSASGSRRPAVGNVSTCSARSTRLPTRKAVTIVNSTCINFRSVCELLEKLAARPLGVPITRVMDNARYCR